MRRFLKVLLSLIVVLGVFLGTSAEVSAKEGFTIDKHVVEMEVEEDGVIKVKETMAVTFQSQLHGIYVNIPKKYRMNWEINDTTVTKSYMFPVRHVKVLSNHKSDIEDYENGVQIKIGDKHKYASTHEEYVFSYEIMTRELDLDGLEMLFMNIISNGWNTTTDRVEFLIKMPKPFDRSKLLFDSPAGVTAESKGPLTIVVSGNTISGSYSEQLQPGEAITVQLLLEKGYYNFPDNNSYALTSLIVAAIIGIAMATVFFLFGKDDPVIETVEFHAPAGVTSAEVGVIIDGVANDGDVISLILDWGRRGLIKIIDEEEKSLVLEKIQDLEPTAKGYEKTMFNKLFENGDSVEVDSLRDKFYKTIHATEEQLDKYFTTNKRRLFTTTSTTLQIVGVLCSFLPIGIMNFIMNYVYWYDTALAMICVGVSAVGIIAATCILVYLDTKRYVHKWYVKALLIVGATILFAVPCVLLIFETFQAGASVMYAIGAIAFNVLVVFGTMHMKKRTEYGNQLLGQVLGLRNFILVAEEDRLRALVDENPYYFYDILPYAYALGLTDVWNDHFKNLTIEPCDWYYSPNYISPYYMMNSLESQMSMMERTMTSAPSESSGGGSIGGGGGGGFSGGGFGGSSGGGW